MSQNLQNFAKFQKFQLDNLVDFEKCCKTHIFLQKSVPIQPKTSNILPKFCRSAGDALQVSVGEEAAQPAATVRTASSQPWDSPARRSWACRTTQTYAHTRRLTGGIFEKCIFRKFCKFLAGSFSAVSKRNFARKYAFDSIFQALQDLHTFAPLQSQNFSKISV